MSIQSRRTGIGILCVALAGGMLSAQTTTSLRLVSTAWPPFTNESGQPRFALDLVEAAFARIGVSSKTFIVAPPAFTSSLLSGSPATSKPNDGKSKFYVGGNMYSDWATIPRQYKVPESDLPEPGRSTATLFTFKW